MSYYLFLDDERMPAIAANHVYPVELRFLYRKETWYIPRNYDEFIAYIKAKGLPKCISFDYDLGPEGTKTGYDCAVWLIDYCNEHGLELPQTLCHSLNPDGKELIQNLFKYYNNPKHD
jgi:hypothetical protein